MRMELYCQSPRCKNPLITNGLLVQNNGALIHLDIDCIESYRTYVHLPPNQNGVPIHYEDAEKLARRGKVKFNKLETGVKK